MNSLKRQMIEDSINYKGTMFEDNYFYSNILRGFSKDYSALGKETKYLYSIVFGEDYLPIFEEIEKNIVLVEDIVSNNNILLFEFDTEWDKWLDKNNIKSPGSTSMGSDVLGDYINKKRNIDSLKSTVQNTAPTSSVRKIPLGTQNKEVIANNIASKKGFLSSIWDKIKTFGKGLSNKYPQLSNFFSKGLSWIISNPAAVAGIAGGSLLLAKLIKALKEKGETKKASRLQYAIDNAKENK